MYLGWLDKLYTPYGETFKKYVSVIKYAGEQKIKMQGNKE